MPMIVVTIVYNAPSISKFIADLPLYHDTT